MPDIATSSKKLRFNPLESNHSLDAFKQFDVTTVIGREYPDLKITQLLSAPNSDAMLAELAYVIADRGVVFFRNQKDLSLTQQKEFVGRVHKQSGIAPESSFHIHPSGKAGQEIDIDQEAQLDKEIFVVSNARQAAIYDRDTLKKDAASAGNGYASRGWHSDVMYENVPAYLSALKLNIVPSVGGDTMWASGREAFERFSKPYQKFLQGLTFTASQQTYTSAAKKGGFELYTVNRGNPKNEGDYFTAVHPVVRTNPATGKNSIYAVGLHCSQINELAPDESQEVLKKLLDMIAHNHDLQCRIKWNAGDLAIWDNTSVFHAATADVGAELRAGNRVTTCGVAPYLDNATLVE